MFSYQTGAVYIFLTRTTMYGCIATFYPFTLSATLLSIWSVCVLSVKALVSLVLWDRKCSATRAQVPYLFFRKRVVQACVSCLHILREARVGSVMHILQHTYTSHAQSIYWVGTWECLRQDAGCRRKHCVCKQRHQ